MKLGVNIDHIAVLREARRINDPDPLAALPILERAGAEQVTIHLREDRRHINDDDAKAIIRHSHLPVNLECSINKEIIDIVCALKPHRATLVPEKRQEVTTEGGLDVIRNFKKIADVCKRLKDNEIDVSLFIDPDLAIIESSVETEADMVELHTGEYANLYAMLYTNLPYTHHKIESLKFSRKELEKRVKKALEAIQKSAIYAKKAELLVATGHGLNYQNVKNITKIEAIEELNIGQSIIARSIWVGLESAIKEMKALLE